MKVRCFSLFLGPTKTIFFKVEFCKCRSFWTLKIAKMQPKITFNVIRKSVTLHINEGQFNFEAQVDLSHTNGKVSMDVAQSLI